MANGYARIALGSMLKPIAKIDITGNRILNYDNPCIIGQVYEFEFIHGHYNGPKRKYRIISDGKTIVNAFDNKVDGYAHISECDIGFFRSQLNEIFTDLD